MPTPRKKITFSHNEDPKDRQTRTVYFDTLGDFYKNMEARKKNLYPHLCVELVHVEDIEVDPYASAFKEDSRYRYNG